MTDERKPSGVHNIDWRAHRLQKRLQARIDIGKRFLRGTTTVGTRKLTKNQTVEKLMSMSPEQMGQLMSTLGPSNKIMTTALSELGPHGLALLPYIQPQHQALAPPQQQGGDDLAFLMGG